MIAGSRFLDVAFSVTSGVLLVLSFPRVGHSAFAWVALVPLLLAVVRARSVAKGFAYGLIAGGVYFAGTIYWIPRVMNEYGGLSGTLAWVVHLLLVAVLALFVAAFGAGLALVARRHGPAALHSAAALWVTTELARIHLFTGFPWVLLGYSQTPVLPIAQLASVAGVLGLSALVVLVNATLAYAVAVGGVRCTRVVAATVAIVLATLGFGAWRLHDDGLRAAGTSLRAAVVQGNIAQHDKWNPVLRDDIVDAYLDLTRAAATGGARLVVWPEAATPFAFQNDPLRADAIRQVARAAGTHLLLGTTDVRHEGVPRYYNAAVMVDAAGETAGIYHKHHLVPFGEYVPLRRLLFFVSPLVESVGDFSAGPGPRTLSMDGEPVGAAICYEIIYPGLVRGFVTRGSRLLVTITNDAWYGPTAAPYQHFQQASMRAIELGRYLVRAANTGISGFVDPYGRVMASTPLYERHMLAADVRLLDARTLYSRTGDIVAYACAVVTALVLWSSGRRRV